jgi:hypothetical protein
MKYRIKDNNTSKNKNKYIITVRSMLGDADGYQTDSHSVKDISKAYEVMKWFEDVFAMDNNSMLDYIDKVTAPLDFWFGQMDYWNKVPLSAKLSFVDSKGVEKDCEILNDEDEVIMQSFIETKIYS